MWRRSRSEHESEPTRRAREAAWAAEAELAKVKLRRPMVQDLSASIVEALRRNHFGEAIERNMELRRGNA